MKMKKNKILLLLLAAIMPLIFSSCITASLISMFDDGSSSLNKNFKKNATGTPENSVLIYGIMGTPGMKPVPSFGYFQADTSKKPNNLGVLSSSNIWLAIPVEPGTRYKAYWGSVTTTYTNAGVRSIQTTHYPFGIGGFTPFDIAVPEKLGLFFEGSYIYDIDNMKKEKPRSSNEKTDRDAELKALNYIVKVCKGTAWEPVVKDRIKELKNAN